jgi:hypothetical protein
MFTYQVEMKHFLISNVEKGAIQPNMKKISLSIILLCLCYVASYGQLNFYLDAEGIFANSKEYQAAIPRQTGKLTTATKDEVTFMMRYKSITYKPNNIWGYRNHDGKDFRAIDDVFYSIDSKEGGIWLYSYNDNGKIRRKMSFGVHQAVDITPENLGALIYKNEALFNRYVTLTKRDRKDQLMAFIEEFNKAYANSSQGTATTDAATGTSYP